MEDSNGVSQLIDGSTSASRVTVDCFSTGDEECLKSDSSSMSMSVCFLVREQAKSLMAIRALQKRVKHLEGMQGEVVSAISEVQDYFSSSMGSEKLHHAASSPKSCTSGKSVQEMVQCHNSSKCLSMSDSKSELNSSKGNLCFASCNDGWKNCMRKSDGECSVPPQLAQQKSLDGIRLKDIAAESDKQDSGLESDCHTHGQESNPPQNTISSSLEKCPSISVKTRQSSDELMDLLDEISEKSEILRQHISNSEEPVQEPRLSLELDKLQLERLGLHNLLSNIKVERDELKSRIEGLETTTDELVSERKDLERRFASTLVEKHKLEAKLMGGLGPFVNRSDSDNSSVCGESKSDAVTVSSLGSGKKGLCKVNSSEVSAILKETNAVELQKQVLTYMMENKIVHSRLDQLEQLLLLKESEKECLDRIHAEETRRLLFENGQLQVALEEMKVECFSLKSKVRMLERVLQSATAENRELNVQLGETMYLKEALQKSQVPAKRPSSITGSSTHFNFPVEQPGEQDIIVSCARSKLLPNTSSYVDVTIEDTDASGNNIALGFGPLGFNNHKASTPMFPLLKQKSKFLDLPQQSPITDFVPTGSQINMPMHRRANKRLTFSSVKPVAQSMNLSLSDSSLRKSKVMQCSSEDCDKILRTSDNTVLRPDLIQDNSLSNHKSLSFCAILEKLKSSSEYKSPNKNCIPEENEENQTLLEDVKNKTHRNSSSVQDENCNVSPEHKCNNNSLNSSQESNREVPKDVRSNSKSIHKRIQNILDRITAESDEAVV